MAELTVPQVNFSPLGELGEIYKKGQDERGLKDAFAGGIGSDPQSLAALAQRVGPYNPQLAINLAQLSHSYTRQGTQDARQQGLDTFNQNMERERLALSKRTADRQDQTPLDKANERGALLDANKIDRNSPEGQAFMISGEWSGPGANGASLNPVYGTVGGKPAMVQTTKSGRAIQTQLPEGFEIAREPIKIDTGTTVKLLDPQTRQLISETPKNPAELERQKTIGDEIAKAQKNYPQNVAAGQQILKTISDIEKDPALWSSVGSYGAIPSFPGSPGANFNAKAAQLKGQTFLQAYNQLKGGGAITDIEGAKGENAIARLDKAQSEKEYRAALKDFREVIQKGILRSAALARGEIGPPKEDAVDPEVLAGKKRPTGPTVETTPGKSGVISYTDYFRQ